MIRIRVDDFPHTKGEPQHTLAAFRSFDRTLREYLGENRYLLGVIPKRCSPDDLLFLRNETDCIIGMHGIEHDEQKLDLYQNEFEPYLTRAMVQERLISAREALEQAWGDRVDIYMPPRNRIDRRTIDVLGKAQFWWYTTGPETSEEFRTGPQHNVGYIHSEPPHEYGRTDELYMRRSYMELNNMHSQQKRDVVLALHWTWETNIGLDHMRRFLDQIPRVYYGSF